MKIAVCIKQVVTREWQVRVNEAKTWVRDTDASWELNEPDAYALEEALRLREKHGGEVIAVSAGPARVTQVLREALARGADRAIHVDGEHLATADAFVAAEALAACAASPAIAIFTGAPICWAAATASHEARLSAPLFCSAITRIMARTPARLRAAPGPAPWRLRPGSRRSCASASFSRGGRPP